MAEPLLALRNVRAGYGQALVLDGISLEVPERGRLAVLGRNGVGKSTLLLTIMGFTDVRQGTIAWRGVDLTATASHRRALRGVGWVPQEREVFPSLTVEENLVVAARPGRWSLDAVYGLFPPLATRRRGLGRHLSGGEQQMLAIARALMTNPALLLLDEPLEGLAPIIAAEVGNAIRRMTAEGIAVILVEQHVELALSLTDTALILERGRIAHAASSAALLGDRPTLERLVGLRLEGGGARRPAGPASA